MRHRNTLALAAAALLVAAAAAHAHSHKFKQLEIVHPWCIETSDGAKPVIVSMTIKNAGRPDRLLSATTAMAAKAELRQGGTPEADGPPIRSVAIGAHAEINLKRAGPHIVLTGMKKPLGPYESFFMTLALERAGKVEVEVMVEEASVLEQPHN